MRDLGFTPAAIGRRVEAGLLIRRRPSVFAYAGTPEFADQRLAEEVLSLGSGAALSHDSAALAWKLITRRPDAPHVVIRRWQREHRTSCIVHESLDLVDDDCTTHAGIRTTKPFRTVVDLGATSPWLVESALSTGLRAGLFEVDDVEEFVGRVQRRGRRGVGVVRPLLDLYRDVDERTESVLEDRFVRILRERRMRIPTPQYEVTDAGGAFVCRADFAYPDRALLIELDGRAYHEDGAAFEADRRKQNATQALGWRTLRFTWSDVTRTPYRTAAIVAHWLDEDPPPVLA
jgi:very-short-patch-repair endonuclease